MSIEDSARDIVSDVWDRPAIETREEFRLAIVKALRSATEELRGAITKLQARIIELEAEVERLTNKDEP